MIFKAPPNTNHSRTVCLGVPPAAGSLPPLPKAQGMLSWLGHPPGYTSGLDCFPCEVWEGSSGGFWEDLGAGVALAEQGMAVAPPCQGC